MEPPPRSQPPPDSSGIRIGDVGGSVNFSALGDIVGGDKITTITTTIQISVEAVTQRPLITASPYRGLDRFEDRDKDLFFGRDQLIKSLLAQLSASNVLLVLGASGSGKSSVVRAGLLPQLSQLIGARFRYFTLVPDVNPFESLRSALQGAGFSQAQTRELADAKPETPAKLIHTLQRSGGQWLFFVDQFEEIFTVGDEKLRASFIAALVQIAQDTTSSTKLVLAMRADFLDRFSPFPQFAKIVEKNIDFVADMHADELRQAIEQPAARHGVVFEKGLVEEIIKDVQGQAGSLPLLQYTLDLLWQEEARDNGLADRHLNARAYRELGGVRGALQKRADEIYASFGDSTDAKAATPKQEIVRQIFLRLVDLAGEGSDAAAWRPVRRRASIAMFTTTQEQEILQALINQKLLVSNREGDDATVEVAHEALFSSWGRLKNWIEAGKQVIFAKNRLADDARRWQRRRQEGDRGADEELLSGSRLAQALDMRGRGDFATVVGGLSDDENLFLDRSAAQREKHARLRRVLQAVGVALLIISIVGAIFGLVGQYKAAAKANEARASAGQAEKAAKAAQLTLSQSDFLRAVELLRDKDPRKTQAALAFLARACRKDSSNELAATRLFSLLSQRNWILPLIDPLVHPDSDLVENVFFHPYNGGEAIVTSTHAFEEETRSLRVWDTRNGALLFGPERSSISCDERWLSPKEPLVLLPLGKEMRIANFVTKEIRTPTIKCASKIVAAQFSPDGKTVVVCGEAGEITDWNVENGSSNNRAVQIRGELKGISRDATRAFVEANSMGRMWKLDFMAGKATPIGIPVRGSFRAMSADGQKVCSVKAEEDKATDIHFATVDSNQEPSAEKITNQPASDASYLHGFRFTLDGARAVTLEMRQTMNDLTAVDSSVNETPAADAEDPDVPGSQELGHGQLRLWDTATGKQIARMWHEQRFSHEGGGESRSKVNFSPDGLRLASTFEDARSLRLWDGRDGAALNELPCLTSDLDSAFVEGVFSPDGTHLATSLHSGAIQVWDIQPTVPLEHPLRVEGKFKKARLSKDGKVIRLLDANEKAHDFFVENGEPAPAQAEFSEPDRGDFDMPDPTGRRRFEKTGQKENERRLVGAASDKWVQNNIILTDLHHFKFSDTGNELLIFGEGLQLLNAETGVPLHETFFGCYNAWLSRDSSKIVLARNYGGDGSNQGLSIVDVASGADLIEPLPYTGLEVPAVALTSDGIVVAELAEDYAEIRRIDFWLRAAPPLLADIAEAIAQHKLNDSGVLEVKTATIPKLREIMTNANASNSQPIFADWLKWFVTPAANRPAAPGSGLTLVQYVEKYVEISSDASLRQLEFLAAGNEQLLAKVAAGRAKIAKRRADLLKSGDANENR